MTTKQTVGLSLLCLLVFCERTLAVSGDLDVQKNVGYRASAGIGEDVTRLVDYILGSQAGFQGRTFGVKRLQFMLMPMMFKMGLMSTLLVVLTVISLKGLTVGVILLVLQLSAGIGKFYALLSQHHPAHQWSPSPVQPVHVHIRGDSSHGNNHPYHGYESPSSGSAVDNESYYYKG